MSLNLLTLDIEMKKGPFFLVVFWFCFLRKDDLNILYRAIVEVGRAWVSLGLGNLASLG